MSSVDLATLIVKEARAAILQKLFDILSAVGVDAESWQSGDPTRSYLYAAAVKLETYETLITDAIKGGFGELATGKWLTAWAASERDTDRVAATYPTCTIRLTNTGNASYAFDPEDLTVSNSATGKTYRNTGATPTDETLASRTLTAGGTLDLIVQAEEAGTDSSSGIGDIDTLVSPSLTRVSVANLTAAVGLDEEGDPALLDRARAKLASLSPNGPAEAYDYIARTPEYNGGANVTKTRTVADTPTGEVNVFLANANGAVDAGDVTLVQAAFSTYCEPLTIQSTALNTTNVTQDVTYAVWVYNSISKTSAEIQADISAALLAGFGARPIGGDVIPPATTGHLYKGFIEATILQAVAPYGFRVSVTVPAADVTLAIDEVAALGAVTPTINLVAP